MATSILYSGGGMHAKLLWSNPSPGSVFSGQWLTLNEDLNNFDYLLIQFPLYKGISLDIQTYWTIFRLNPDQYQSGYIRLVFGCSHDEGIYRARRINWNATDKNRIYISSAYNNSNAAEESDKIVPYRIYGIKGKIYSVN